MALGALSYAEYKDRVGQIEDPSGDPNATSSAGAKGIFQFTPETWAKYGVGDITDPAAQEAAMVRLTQANRMALAKALGRDPTPAQLYLAHQQGAPGAIQLLLNPSARAGDVVSAKAISGNGGDPNASASQFVAMWDNKFNKRSSAEQGYSPQFLNSLKNGDPLTGGTGAPSNYGYSPAFMKAIAAEDLLAGQPVAPKPKIAPTTPASTASPVASPSPPVTVQTPLPEPSAVNAAASGFVNGIPIAGPYALSALQKLTAWGQSKATGQPYDQALADIQQYGRSSMDAYPKTAMAGGVGGTMAGTAPLMAAAPAAFGMAEAPLILNAGASALSGAGLGAADAAARNGLDFNAIKNGAVYGGAGGIAGPVIGSALGGMTTAGLNLLARTTPGARNVGNIFQEIGMSPQAAQVALAKMGPEATLADLDPALTHEAGGLASMGGAPTSILKNAMAARAAGKDTRVNDVVTQNLGGRPDLTMTAQAIKSDASTSAGPYYQAASGAPLNIAPVLSYIDSQLPNAKGAVASALNTAKSYLVKKDPSGMLVPEDSPQALLGARQAIDDLIDTAKRGTSGISAGSNAIRQATAVRSQLDQVLKTDPNIAVGDAIYATKMGELDALQSGVDVFKKGTRIEDLRRDMAQMTPEQVDALRTGTLSAIHDELDGVQGDFSAARRMFSKSTANRAKLDAIFPNSDAVLSAIEGEMAQRATEQTVAQNSATAGRQAVQQKYAPSAQGVGASIVPTLAGEALYGGPGAVAAWTGSSLFNHLRNQIGQSARMRLRTQTAQGLAAQGGARDDFVRQVDHAMATKYLADALRHVASGSNLVGRSVGEPLNQTIWSGYQAQ